MTKVPLEELGPTGEFPEGKIHPTDEGAIKIGVAAHPPGQVTVHFGTRVAWISMDPDQARQFAKMILKQARAAERRR